jgi:hypothetical protein
LIPFPSHVTPGLAPWGGDVDQRLRLLETPQGPTPLWSVPAANLPPASAHPDRAVKIAETGAIYVSTLVGGVWTWVPGGGLFSKAEMSGLVYSASGASTSFSVSAGRCADDSGAVMLDLPTAMSKSTATWAEGNAQGGVSGGEALGGEWAHLFLIGKASGQTDIIAKKAAAGVAPSVTLPSGYIYKRRIATVPIASTGNYWFDLVQNGDEFLFKTYPVSVNGASQGVAAQSYLLAVPRGLTVEALMYAMMNSNTNGIAARIYSPYQPDEDTNFGRNQFVIQTPGNYTSAELRVRTNTSAQVRAISSATSQTCILWMSVRGWIDRRGRDG